MPILDIQKRARELGRIRIGQVQPTASGKTRPAKLDRFRVTSHSRPLIESVAALYGGTATEWQPQGGGPAGWEVLTDATRLPILVPPQPISQYLEHWSKGGCARRCDGVRELLSDKACLCGPDPSNRLCKPTTRLNVVLREVEGIGVFRLETHGYYAAVELPMAAELLASAGNYIQGYLGLEERVIKRDGETRRFMVPTIDIAMTPQQLLAGGGAPAAQLDSGQRAALPAGPGVQDQRALPAAPSVDVDSVRAAIAAIDTVDDLRAMWADIKTAGLEDVAKERAAELKAAEQPEQQPAGEGPQTSPNPDDITLDSGTGTSGGDADAAWAHVMTVAPEDWSTTQVEEAFTAFANAAVEEGTATQFRKFAVELAKRAKAGA
jgi:hypothetical protein